MNSVQQLQGLILKLEVLGIGHPTSRLILLDKGLCHERSDSRMKKTLEPWALAK